MKEKNILPEPARDFTTEFFIHEYFQESQNCQILSYCCERETSSTLSFGQGLPNNIALSFNQAGQEAALSWRARQEATALSWNALSYYYELCTDPGADSHIGWFSKPKSDELSDVELEAVLLDVDKKLSETIAWIGNKEPIELGFFQANDDFTVHSYWHQIFHDSYKFDKWYHEIVPQIASVEVLNKLSGHFESITKKFAFLRRLINVLIRRFSSGNFRMDYRLGFRKKTNIIFKNLDDEHHLSFQRVIDCSHSTAINIKK